MRAALIDDEGRVHNVILVGEDFVPDEAMVLIEVEDDSPVGPGWFYMEEEFVSPDVPPPSVPLEQQVAEQQAQIDVLIDIVLELIG